MDGGDFIISHKLRVDYGLGEFFRLVAFYGDGEGCDICFCCRSNWRIH